MKPNEIMATNIASLGNVVEVASGIVEKIAGNEISNQLDGKTLNAGDLADVIATKIQSRLVAYMPREAVI